jgi:acyl-CoA thioesterase I
LTGSLIGRLRAYGGFAAVFHLLIAAALWSSPAHAAPPQRETLILAFGDSLTAGYQLKPAESFPAQLQASLRAEGRRVTVHNAGVSGDTTAAARARIGWVLAGLKRKPDLVIVALGANDMLRGQPVAAARANLDATIIAFRSRGAKVLLAGMLASRNLGADYSRAFDAMYPALARRHGVPLYPFLLAGVAMQPKLQLADGMHPNPAGVATMVRGILPAVRKALDR